MLLAECIYRFVLILFLFVLSEFSSATSPHTNYDVREATVESLHAALYGGITTCRSIVEAFLARIEAYNPTINAIISLNPNALSIASDMDANLATNPNTSSLPLHCIPILLKDNYNTVEMSTTGGCLDLANSQPSADAPVVTAFKNAGAIILGKTNLHELALEGLTVSSLGGQTRNPYDLSRTPGGSSGGTGAAIAASFAVFGTGTDTVNSLRSPASANSLFSLRPTRGLISRSGIIPISYTQDAIGPIARSTNDLAVALNVMTSLPYDPNDNVTSLVPPDVRGTDYVSFLRDNFSLRDLRIGVIEGFFNRTSSPETSPVNTAMNATLSFLASSGATIIPITNETTYNATAISSQCDVQTFEYNQQLSAYLSDPLLHGSHPQSMPALYNKSTTSPQNFLVIPSQYPYIRTALRSSSNSNSNHSSYTAFQQRIAALTLTLSTTFSSQDLDILIYPEQKNLVVPIGSASQSGRNGILAAVTGHPVMTVPIGFSQEGVPIGMEVLGRKWGEGMLLAVGRALEVGLRGRRMPGCCGGIVEGRRYERVPVVVPDRGSVPGGYPLGVY